MIPRLQILILLVGVLHASPARAQVATEEAKERFDNGVILFKAGNYEGALVEFEAAYEAQPHFAVRYNIGITLYKLHRYLEAYVELEAYLLEGGSGIDEERQVEVQETLKALKKFVGVLEVRCEVEGARLIVEGEEQEGLTVPLNVGVYVIGVEAEGYEAYSKKIALLSGERLSLDVELVEKKKAPPPPKRKTIHRGFFWSGLAVTGVLTATAVLTGVLAWKEKERYDELRGYDDWRPVQEKGRALTIATDVFIFAAGAAAVTTLVFGFFTEFKKEAPVEVSVSLQDGGMGVVIGGTF